MASQTQSPVAGDDRAPKTFCFPAEQSGNNADPRETRDAIASRSASPEAFAAARDLAFEGLVETGSLAESYSRSLAEAAWRGDQSTVEVHLRQLRACVVASIDFFRRLDGAGPKGAGA